MPKHLRVIAPKRKHNEYEGNTPDEKKMVNQFKAGTKIHDDPAKNGPDVFSGSKQAKSHKPVDPGDDEDRYAEYNGEVANVGDTPEKTLSQKMRQKDY